MLSSGDFYTIFARIFSSFFHVSLFVFLPFVSAALKFRYYEKATKFEKISHLFWQNSCFYSVGSKKWEIFSIFCGLFRKAELYEMLPLLPQFHRGSAAYNYWQRIWTENIWPKSPLQYLQSTLYRFLMLKHRFVWSIDFYQKCCSPILN